MYFEARQIIEETTFQESIDEYSVLFPQLEDVKASVSWLLSRRPYAGDSLPIATYFTYTTTAVGRMPSFVILYQYEEDPSGDAPVYLVNIRPLAGSDAEWE